MTDLRQPPPPQGALPHAAKGIASSEARDPAGLLLRALETKNNRQKRSFAEQGLRALEGGEDEVDEELEALLLRQIYLADIEEGHDIEALDIACELIELGTLGDIARQDAARAALGIPDIRAAISHLRVAAHVCPPERRAFHYGHLGSLLRFDGQSEEAVTAFDEALRWATDHHDLYEAQRLLTLGKNGCEPVKLQDLRDKLEDEEARPAYALWILGELCLLLGDHSASEDYLRRFLSRQIGATRAKNLALKGEIAHATALLEKIPA